MEHQVMINDSQPRRNPLNTNQKLFWDNHYKGFPVQTTHGPLIKPYLDGLVSTVDRAQREFPRVFAVRVDLRFSQLYELPDIAAVNSSIRAFFSSLKAKLDWKYRKTRIEKGQANAHGLRYIWAREIGTVSGRPHYHVILLLNGNAYRAIGGYSNPEAPGLYKLVMEAWASAIGLDYDLAYGLVSVTNNGAWMLHRGSRQCLESFIYAASYLCKSDTKQYLLGEHGFSSSRH